MKKIDEKDEKIVNEEKIMKKMKKIMIGKEKKSRKRN